MLRGLATLAAGASLLWLAACDRAGAPSFRAIDITGADYARDLNLPDFDGRPRSLADSALQAHVPLVIP